MQRLFDIIFSITLILALSAVYILAYLLIRILSGGSAIVTQKVVGKDMKVFDLYRFRITKNGTFHYFPILSMSGLENNRLGKLFARLHIHALPQLFNVLKGDMSIVGPVPELPQMLNHYKKKDQLVFSVRPGLFRPSMGSLKREFDFAGGGGIESYYKKKILQKKIKLDLEYLNQRSMFSFLKLIVVSAKDTFLAKLKQALLKERISNTAFLPVDVVLVALSYYLAYNLRFDWKIPQHELNIFLLSLPFVIAIRVSVFSYFRIYKNLWKYIGVRDLLAIIKASCIGSLLCLAVIFFVGFSFHSRSVFLIDWFLVIFLIGGSRIFFRMYHEKSSQIDKVKKNVIIYGAGEIGAMLTKQLDMDSKERYNVVGFIDDDCKKKNMAIHGIKVLGDRARLAIFVSALRVDEVYIAISKISSKDIKSILQCCKEADVKYRIVPAVSDLLNGRMHLSKMRKVEISDLFGREPVELDLRSIRNFLEARTLFVTGAGGSIGSELCRQIAAFNPKKLIMIDKSENYLQELQTELGSDFPNANLVFSLTNITNKQKMENLFEFHKPDVVFHAAAQKHVPFGEREPEETVFANIQGTQIAAMLSHQYEVENFLLISTDKAVNPTSVMGVCKRVAELIIQEKAKTSNTTFATVRFGNVLNSNGSVVPLFMKQIENGGPITVTHPEIERFFMSISEAVQLVLQGITMNMKSKVFILDMGKSIKIADLAVELIKLVGLEPNDDINIEYTGLRPGEKMYEELVAQNEKTMPTLHKNIQILEANGQSNSKNLDRELDELLELASSFDRNGIYKKLHAIVPEYDHSKLPAQQNEAAVEKRLAVSKSTIHKPAIAS